MTRKININGERPTGKVYPAPRSFMVFCAGELKLESAIIAVDPSISLEDSLVGAGYICKDKWGEQPGRCIEMWEFKYLEGKTEISPPYGYWFLFVANFIANGLDVIGVRAAPDVYKFIREYVPLTLTMNVYDQRETDNMREQLNSLRGRVAQAAVNTTRPRSPTPEWR